MNYSLKENNAVMKKSYLILFVSILLFSCGVGKKLSAEKYLSWYHEEKKNFTINDTIDQIAFGFTYVPNEQDAANCLLNSCLAKEEIKKELSVNKQNQQFVLRVQVLKPGMDIFTYENSNFESSITNRQHYLSFEMKHTIKLITKMGDTLDCSYWFYEPSVAGSGLATIECAFKSVSMQSMKSIVIHDQCFTGNKREISLENLPISSIPTLKIK